MSDYINRLSSMIYWPNAPMDILVRHIDSVFKYKMSYEHLIQSISSKYNTKELYTTKITSRINQITLNIEDNLIFIYVNLRMEVVDFKY